MSVSENSQELIRRVKRDGVELVEYGIHILLNYYFVIEDDAFYYCDGEICKKLDYGYDSGKKYIYAKDKFDNKNVKVYYNKFKKDNLWIWKEFANERSE